MDYPTLSEMTTLATSGDYRCVPLSTTILSDAVTPITVLRILKGISPHTYLFESADATHQRGRYTFLGYDPTLCITCLNGHLHIEGDTVTDTDTAHPADAIRQILADYHSPQVDGLPPFTGGLVGYFSYDYIKYSEPSLNLDAPDTEGFMDVDLMLFDQVIAFDHHQQKIILITNIRTDNLEASYAQGVEKLAKMADLITNGTPAPDTPGQLTTPFTPLFDREHFCQMVRNTQEAIHEGEIFQAVVSNRLEAGFTGSLLDTYRLLRTTNPSPYLFYLSSNEIEIAGASPETLVRLKDGNLETYPLAGTRPRGKDAEEDAKLEAELLADEKECAEHNMLVDLGRNDIGRLSEFGSVHVDKYMAIEKFSHVMHIGSTVSGRLRSDLDALDAVDAILPAGTLSGAPKLRACQLINDMEQCKRGIYGGAIGYLDFAGNLDTAIAIRLAFAKNGKVFVRAGAGIVADSNPDTEYEECINKAKAVMAALTQADGGIVQ